MPFYDYYCSECESTFSVFLSMTEEQQSCTKCTSSEITKVVHGIMNPVDQSRYKSSVGDVVKSHIKQAKQEVKEEKEKMKREIDR